MHFNRPSNISTDGLLRILYWIGLFASVCLGLVSEYVGLQTSGTLITSVASGLLSIACLVLLQRGFKSASVTLLTVFLLLATTILAYQRGGLLVPVIAFFPMSIVIAGLYSRPAHALYFGLASVVVILALWSMHQFGWIEGPSFVVSPTLVMVFNLIAAVSIGVSVYINAREREQKALEAAQATADLQIQNRELLASEKRFKNLINSLGDSVLLIHQAGFIVDVNTETCKTLQYSEAELQGLAYTNLCPEWDVVGVLVQLDAVPTGDPILVYGTHQARDGSDFPVETQASIIEHRGEVCILAVARDITERQRTEALLRQSQKVQSMGVMAGGIAHDFNNLLVAMLGQSSVALRKLPEDDKATKHIKRVVDAANSARKLTKQLLAYSGNDTAQMEEIDLNNLIETNLDFFDVSVPPHVTLSSDLELDLPNIMFDPAQLQQVVMNLIINASEAIVVENGTIHVTTTFRKLSVEECKYPYVDLAPGKYVQLNVIDNGIGMDTGTLERIFDPFFTTKDHGHGLGLAAVMGIVRGHNGMLHVKSTPGKGSRFEVLLPAIPKSSRNTKQLAEDYKNAMTALKN